MKAVIPVATTSTICLPPGLYDIVYLENLSNATIYLDLTPDDGVSVSGSNGIPLLAGDYRLLRQTALTRRVMRNGITALHGGSGTKNLLVHSDPMVLPNVPNLYQDPEGSIDTIYWLAFGYHAAIAVTRIWRQVAGAGAWTSVKSDITASTDTSRSLSGLTPALANGDKLKMSLESHDKIGTFVYGQEYTVAGIT